MTEKKEAMEAFEKDAIAWGKRVGIADDNVSKVAYWCVLNVVNLQKKIDNLNERLKNVKQ